MMNRLRVAALGVMLAGVLVSPVRTPARAAMPAVLAVSLCPDLDWQEQDFETRYAYAESDDCPSGEIFECTSGEFIEEATFTCEAWCDQNWGETIREDNYYTLDSPCWYECQCAGVPPVI